MGLFSLQALTGQTVPIQAEIGGEDYADEVAARMQEDPDVVFAVSNDIRAAVLAEYPELSSQFIDTQSLQLRVPSPKLKKVWGS